MALQFSHAVGYRGVCRLFNVKKSANTTLTPSSTNSTTLLCTGGNINLTQDPIMGSGVWGAGYQNAAPIAYAWNYLNLEGSANFQLTRDKCWDYLNKFAFTDRTTEKAIQLYPDGMHGFFGNGWLSSLGFDASEGSAVTGNFNFKGDPSGNNISAIDYSSDSSSWQDGSKQGQSEKSFTGTGASKKNPLAGAMLVPYWETQVEYYQQPANTTVTAPASETNKVLRDVISWSCSYNSDIQMLKCCTLQQSAPLSADYILLGQMSADGNYTVFRIAGNFDPKRYHQQKQLLSFCIGAFKGSNSTASTAPDGRGKGSPKSGNIERSSSDGTIDLSQSNTYLKGAIVIPYAIVNSASTSMTTGASYVQAQFSFTALGDGINGIMTMAGDLQEQ